MDGHQSSIGRFFWRSQQGKITAASSDLAAIGGWIVVRFALGAVGVGLGTYAGDYATVGQRHKVGGEQ